MTTQARSLSQTQLIQHQRLQQCFQGNSVNVTNTLEDSHFDKLHQHHSKETSLDEMMIEDDDERQKNSTPEETNYESRQHNNSHTSDIQSDDIEQQRHNRDPTMQQQHRQPSHQDENICAGCNKSIKDRYLLEALDKRWHEDCLKCAGCGCRLGELGSSLFINAGKILCKHDFLRIFGNEGCCAACKKSIPPYELVMRANKNAYHMDCFACQQCNYRFCVGDKFHLQDDHKIICLLCQCENESHLSSHTSGSTFSQSSTNFNSSQESVYEQQNQQQHFSPQNQQCNNVPPFHYNNQQCPPRSKQPTDTQHYYQIHYPKSQTNTIATKMNAPTSNQPLDRLNDMLLVGSNHHIHETSGLDTTMGPHNDMHYAHQNHQHFMYRPQNQISMNQHHAVSLPQQTQQNIPGMQQMNSGFTAPPSINQHVQIRNLSFVPQNHNQPNHLSQVMNHSKQQVIIHHQQSSEFNPEFSLHPNNGNNIQPRNLNNQHNQVPSQPQLSTIHHRNRDYDSQDNCIAEQQQHQSHSYPNIKDELIKAPVKLCEIFSPSANGNQIKAIKAQKDIGDNHVGIGTTTPVCSTTPSAHNNKKQDHDGNRPNHQQIYIKNEPAESSESADGSEKAIDNILEASLSPSKLKRNVNEKPNECGDDSPDQSTKIIPGNQQSKSPTSAANCKRRKTKDDDVNGVSPSQTRTIEALLQKDICSDSSEQNNIDDVDELTEEQLSSSDPCPISATNDNDTKRNALDLQQTSKQQYLMSISGSTDHATSDSATEINTSAINTSESSISLSESSVGKNQQMHIESN